jgi:hypothetical protein
MMAGRLPMELPSPAILTLSTAMPIPQIWIVRHIYSITANIDYMIELFSTSGIFIAI